MLFSVGHSIMLVTLSRISGVLTVFYYSKDNKAGVNGFSGMTLFGLGHPTPYLSEGLMVLQY